MKAEKKKSLRSALIKLAMFLLAVGALVYFIIIPLYGPQDKADHEEPEIAFYEGNGKTSVLENDELRFEIDGQTTYFTVTDKKTGAVWTSVPADAESDPIANSTTKDILMSTLVLTYSTDGGAVDLNNYKYSIQNQTYTIEETENSICVHYVIGKIEKTYRIPIAITAERYKDFCSRMSKASKKKIESNYTLYDPAKLDSKSNKDEIIALYPEVVNQPLYILKSDTSETGKKKIEGYFAEANYTQEDYEYDMSFVAGSTVKAQMVFNVDVVYRLDGSDLVVEVPYSEIRYTDGYPITYLTVLPMFGAAGVNDDGFMLIPDGGGALIYNNNGKNSQNSYYANLYGWDYATQREEAVHETHCEFPVFGMSKGGSSFVCIIEGASSYAGILADISGRNNSYNWLCTKYNVLHVDEYNVSAKTAQLVYMYEKQIPDDTIIQRYRFVESGEYSDMAAAYGDYLEQTAFADAAAVSGDVPVCVEFIAAIDKTVEKFGVPVDSVVATTTFEDAQSITAELMENGLTNISVKISGWANGGITQSVLTKIKPEKCLGGKNGMSELQAFASENAVTLYFDGISCFAYDSDLLDGFMPFSDAARYTTRDRVLLYNYDVVTYVTADWQDSYYLVKPAYAEEKGENLVDYLADNGMDGVAFRDLGNLLSADYNPKDTVSREQVKEMNTDVLARAKDEGLKVSVKAGNDYALHYADLVTDMDFSGTPYSIIDAHIPFYQIAIHGKVNYTGEALNLTGDYVEALLTCAEYGSGLNFCFMAEDTRILQDTLHSAYHASYYDSWKDIAIDIGARYINETAGLNSLKITSHEILAKGVTVTVYEDGTRVYVNRTGADLTADGAVVLARDYAVIRGNEK